MIVYRHGWMAEAMPPDHSRFISTYDPRVGIEKFGFFRSLEAGESHSPSSHGTWISRYETLRVGMDDERVSEVLAAMQSNVRDTFSRTHTRFSGGGAASATYYSQYEESHARGSIRIGPAYRDPSAPGLLVVPVSIEEHWMAH